MAGESPGGKCPVDHANTPSGPPAGAGKCPVDHGEAAPAPSHPAGKGGQCPVDHGKGNPEVAMPPAQGGKCPMGHDSPASGASKGPVYNVYGQEINPRNMMPSLAQKPAPGQTEPLSTHRVQSSIPKGGTDKETWLYPSPQQFYNALVRKDKADNVSESDMEHVVAIHNAMNERAWGMLRDWERRFHAADLGPGCPKLRRFMGRPFEPSPKARIKSLLGFGDPFDRHDWYIDRGDGTEVRYVLDYYFDAKAEAADPDPTSTACIHVDVRPAVDSPMAVLERLAAFPGRAWEAIKTFRRFADGTDPEAVPDKFTVALGGGGNRRGAAKPASGAVVHEASDRLAVLSRKCDPLRVRLAEAKDEEARQAAFIGLTYCMGSVTCPAEAGAFMRAVEAADMGDEREAEAFSTMRECVVTRLDSDVKLVKAEEEARKERA